MFSLHSIVCNRFGKLLDLMIFLQMIQSLSTFLATMVQIQMKPLPSTTDSHPQAQTNKSFDSIISQHQLSNSTGANISDTGIFSNSNLSSFITWTSKSDISSNRSSVQLQNSVVCYLPAISFFEMIN